MKRFESLQGCLGIRSETHVQMFCVEKKDTAREQQRKIYTESIHRERGKYLIMEK